MFGFAAGGFDDDEGDQTIPPQPPPPPSGEGVGAATIAATIEEPAVLEESLCFFLLRCLAMEPGRHRHFFTDVPEVLEEELGETILEALAAELVDKPPALPGFVRAGEAPPGNTTAPVAPKRDQDTENLAPHRFSACGCFCSAAVAQSLGRFTGVSHRQEECQDRLRWHPPRAWPGTSWQSGPHHHLEEAGHRGAC